MVYGVTIYVNILQIRRIATKFQFINESSMTKIVYKY